MAIPSFAAAGICLTIIGWTLQDNLFVTAAQEWFNKMASNHSCQTYCWSVRAKSVRIASLFPLVRRRLTVNPRLMDAESAETNASGIRIRSSALLGLVVMFQSDDYISLFVSLIDIPVRLGSLFQWIQSVNDRFYVTRLNKLFEEY